MLKEAIQFICSLIKATYLLVKTSTTVDQMGTAMNVDSYHTDYTDTNGVIITKENNCNQQMEWRLRNNF